MIISDVIKILLVEDDDGDAALLQHSFSKIRTFEANIVRTVRLSEACEKLSTGEFDIVLLDLSLPDGDGVENIDTIRSEGFDTPIVVLTGLNNEESAWAAMEKGAHEYIVKGEVSSSFLPKVIRYAIESARYRAELENAKAGLEEEVRKRTADLQVAHRRALRSERLAAIGQMVAGLAHESRNSLQRIQSSVNRLVRRFEGKEDLLSIASYIDSAVDDLRRLYDTVKEYASPLNFETKNCDLVELWKESVEKVKAVEQGADVKCDIRGDSLYAKVDRHGIQQVFRNIIENSLQAAPDEGGKLLVCFSNFENQGKSFLRLRYRDNGPGLSEEQAQRLFEPFYTTKNKGTGLGMAISKRIVDEHGGTIRVGENLNDLSDVAYDSGEYSGIYLELMLPANNSSDYL